MKAIYKRELMSYFHSMIGYVFIAFLVAFAGIYFMAYNLNGGYPYFAYTLAGVIFVLIIAVPVLTMKCFAEEQKSKTDQMLLTAPVRLYQIVLGKYFAMATVFLVPTLIFCLFPLIILSQGTAYLLVDYCSIFVFFLIGCVYISIGMFVSALTESQIIAAIGAAGLLLITYMWDGIISFLPTSALGNLGGIILILSIVSLCIFELTKNWVISAAIEIIGIAACVIVFFVKSSLLEGVLSKVLGSLILTQTYTNVSGNNAFDISGIVMQLSVIVVFVYLTIQTIQKRRWS